MTYTSPVPVTDGHFYAGSRLELDQVCMAYGDIDVIRDVSISVEPGTTTCIIGPSGSGKSTLLRGVNRLHEPKSGRVTLAGDDALALKPDVLRRRIGLVFQHFNLFPDHTALQNVALALRNVKKIGKKEAERIAAERLEEVGLAERADHRPRDLSGGQQQRVAIARALAPSPRVLLCDEPTSALDPELAEEVVEVLSRLAREGTTMVMATHDLRLASRVADKVIFLDGGVIVESGAPKTIFSAPERERTKKFIASLSAPHDYEI